MKMKLGSKTFPTKKAATEEVRAILDRYSQALMPVAGEDLAVLLDLFSLHPRWEDKLGCGIRAVTVEQNPMFPTTYGFWITRIDGSRTDIGFRKCFNPPSYASEVRQAFRREVVDQVHGFKVEHLTPGAKCAVTGECLDEYTSENVHVDHDPPFADLLVDFLKQERVTLSNIELTGESEDCAIGRELKDQALAQRWSDFHKEKAGLRLTTKYANLVLLRREAS